MEQGGAPVGGGGALRGHGPVRPCHPVAVVRGRRRQGGDRPGPAGRAGAQGGVAERDDAVAAAPPHAGGGGPGAGGEGARDYGGHGEGRGGGGEPPAERFGHGGTGDGRHGKNPFVGRGRPRGCTRLGAGRTDGGKREGAAGRRRGIQCANAAVSWTVTGGAVSAASTIPTAGSGGKPGRQLLFVVGPPRPAERPRAVRSFFDGRGRGARSAARRHAAAERP